MSRWNKRCWPWWSEFLIGILMLLVAGFWGFISLANGVGLGVAALKIAAGLIAATWIIVGVIFVARGLSKRKW